MTTRIKRTGRAIETRAQMETLVGEIAELKIKERQLSADLDAETQAVRERYEAPLAAVRAQQDDKVALAQGWAEQNPEEFGKLKSIAFTHGTVGFRTGTPKLKPLTGWTWDRVLEKLKTLGHGPWLRVKEDVNKEAILSAHAEGAVFDADLRNFGCRVVQEESFYVEPKLTEVETRETAKA